MLSNRIWYSSIRLIWGTLLLSLLTFAWVQRDVHDMPVAATMLAAGLSMPAGPVVLAVVGIVNERIDQVFGMPYSPFFDFVIYWIFSSATVYIQWFLLLPKLIALVRGRHRERLGKH